MKQSVIFILLLIGGAIQSEAQTQPSVLYEKAYDYLNDSIVKIQYVDSKTFADHCEDCCVRRANGRRARLKFESELQVAYKFNEIRRGFPIEDYIKRNYNLSHECIVALRMGLNTCEEVNEIIDSLSVFFGDYTMKDEDEIIGSLQALPSKRKDGYQVFFSDIYKNTLSAELMSFCTPYDTGAWYGRSTFFFFIFDEGGEIKEIYSGQPIHYN
ncbi:hypothetical protein [Algivirga pacifica]